MNAIIVEKDELHSFFGSVQFREFNEDPKNHQKRAAVLEKLREIGKTNCSFVQEQLSRAPCTRWVKELIYNMIDTEL